VMTPFFRHQRSKKESFSYDLEIPKGGELRWQSGGSNTAVAMDRQLGGGLCGIFLRLIDGIDGRYSGCRERN